MKSKIKEDIIDGKDAFEIRNEIVQFKNSGGTQKEATNILKELRNSFQEEKEDKILELLDFVSGWCQKKYRIW